MVHIYDAIAKVLAELRLRREERGGLACEPRQVRDMGGPVAGQKTRESRRTVVAVMTTNVAPTSITPRR